MAKASGLYGSLQSSEMVECSPWRKSIFILPKKTISGKWQWWFGYSRHVTVYRVLVSRLKASNHSPFKRVLRREIQYASLFDLLTSDGGSDVAKYVGKHNPSYRFGK